MLNVIYESPPLSLVEYSQLEKNIIADGCREPLVVFNNTLVDGHNRYEICTKHDLPFSILDKEFADSGAAKLWMIDNQNGRRNLTDGWKYQLTQSKKEILLEQGKIAQVRKPEYHGKECPECEHYCWETDDKCPECDFNFMTDFVLSTIDKTKHNTRDTKEQAAKFPDVVLPTVLQFRNQGDTLPVIADKLNNMGVKTRRVGKWYASTVTNILKRA